MEPVTVSNATITWPQVMKYIAEDLLGITEEYLDDHYEEQAERLNSWNPLLSVRTNAEVVDLQRKANIAIERMEEIAKSVGQLIEKAKDVEGKKATLSAETCLMTLEEIQYDYKILRSKHCKILKNEGIKKLIQKIQDKIGSDNYRSITNKSIKLVIDYHDGIDEDILKKQIDLCHKNTESLKLINKELKNQYCELSKEVGYYYDGGPIKTLEAKWEKNCKQLMTGTANIPVIGSAINSTCETVSWLSGNEIAKYDILETDLTKYKKRIVIPFEKKYKGRQDQLKGKNEAYLPLLADFFSALNKKLTDNAKIIYNSDSAYERSSFAMLYVNPKKVYKEVCLLGQIPDNTKKKMVASIKITVQETIDKFVKIKDKLSDYTLKIQALNLNPISQCTENESLGPNEDAKPYLVHLNINPTSNQKFAKEEPTFIKLVNRCIKYGNLYKKLSQDEINLLTMPCNTIRQELIQLSAKTARTIPSMKAIQQIECAFDTNRKTLVENCSFLIKRKEDLNEILLNLNEKETVMNEIEQKFIKAYNDKAEEIHTIARQIKNLKGSGEIQAENKGPFNWTIELFETPPDRNYIHKDIKVISELQEFVLEGQDSSEEIEEANNTHVMQNRPYSPEEEAQAKQNAFRACEELLAKNLLNKNDSDQANAEI